MNRLITDSKSELRTRLLSVATERQGIETFIKHSCTNAFFCRRQYRTRPLTAAVSHQSRPTETGLLMRSATLALENVSQIPGAEAAMCICSSAAYWLSVFLSLSSKFGTFLKLIVTATVGCLAKFLENRNFPISKFWGPKWWKIFVVPGDPGPRTWGCQLHQPHGWSGLNCAHRVQGGPNK